MAVYILHFDSKISHAQHYTGYSAKPFDRTSQHGSGSCDVRIIQVFRENEIGFTVGRIWHKKGREFERYLKKTHKNIKVFCLICKKEKN